LKVILSAETLVLLPVLGIIVTIC